MPVGGEGIAPLASSPLGSTDSPLGEFAASALSEDLNAKDGEQWLKAKFLAIYANRRVSKERNQTPQTDNFMSEQPVTEEPTPPGDPIQSASGFDTINSSVGNKTATCTGRELERRTSYESNLSSDSRESVVSAASIRAENCKWIE